jgi:hypothetical protein
LAACTPLADAVGRGAEVDTGGRLLTINASRVTDT